MIPYLVLLPHSLRRQYYTGLHGGIILLGTLVMAVRSLASALSVTASSLTIEASPTQRSLMQFCFTLGIFSPPIFSFQKKEPTSKGSTNDMFYSSLTTCHVRYILFTIEPLYHCAYLTDWEYQVLEGYFNTTFSFREDADIFLPFGRVVLKPEYRHMSKGERWIKMMKPELDEGYKMTLRKKNRLLLRNLVLLYFPLFQICSICDVSLCDR